MNYLPTEEEDKSFQEGRAIALYLEAFPCRNPKPNGAPCGVCIGEAIRAAEDNDLQNAEAEKRKRAQAAAVNAVKRGWTII